VNNSDKLSKLSGILQSWMEIKAPQVAIKSIKDKLKRKNITSGEAKKPLQEEKFQLQNFDLIVWEYVTNNNAL